MTQSKLLIILFFLLTTSVSTFAQETQTSVSGEINTPISTRKAKKITPPSVARSRRAIASKTSSDDTIENQAQSVIQQVFDSLNNIPVAA